MNSLILSGFVALLVIVSVHSQDANRCGVLGRKCRDGQYCYRPNENYQNVEYCRAYRRKGAICDDKGRKCMTGLECKERQTRYGVSRTKVCQDPSSDNNMTTMPTMMPTDMSTNMPDMSTNMPDMSSNMPEMSTNMPDMSTDEPAIVTDPNEQ
ncbi:uncharacterized protein TNCT_639652 [Trichonephila clavata]|uniref:Uncharacterized protein n=1 Tax=Trichonephila clavata TaxID=2740835 RepID=A0A8X6J141_TRICU|nr:uncharacterized protein TNCT_639652 [Trichonephila clavata]